MADYSIETCSKFNALNKILVEKEINFSRTVVFSSEIDLTEIEKIRAQSTSNHKPSYTAFIARAIALALVEFPYANRRLFRFWGIPFLSFYQTFKNIDISVAIERNVESHNAVAYMEVLREVHKSSLNEVTEKLREFNTADLNSSAQWRAFYNLGMKVPSLIAGWIASLPYFFPNMWKKYRGGAAMISSPAKYGVDGVVGAWTHPLGFSFGLAQKKPMVKNDQVVAVQAFTFVMNFDRRVMAGAQAARFFSRICELLRQPRISPRIPVTIPAAVDKNQIQVVNISETGLGIICDQSAMKVNEEQNITFSLDHERQINIKAQPVWQAGDKFGLKILEASDQWREFYESQGAVQR